ncbi:MAG: phosphotransferase family protein [Dehalococcoidia bacterium]
MDAPPVTGIDGTKVSRWLAEHVPGASAGPLQFELIGDGRSNLSYRVSNSAGQWVLRRPPLGQILATAHDMAREYRVQAAVTSAGFPAPAMLALCDDPEVNGQPFYVMDFCDGVILVDGLPGGFAATDEWRRQLSARFVETLVALHAIDYQQVDLSGFGRPENYVERQLARWSRQWEHNRTRDLPEIDRVTSLLSRAIPVSPAPTIVHGDYRLGNIIWHRSNPGELLAVLDWEMSTIGDPLADLGYTLLWWGEPGDGPRPQTLDFYAQVTSSSGFYSRDQLVSAYAAQSGRDVSSIDFYRIFAAYKLAVIFEGLYKRFLDGQTVAEGYEDYAVSAPELVQYAIDIAAQSSDPRLT